MDPKFIVGRQSRLSYRCRSSAPATAPSSSASAAGEDADEQARDGADYRVDEACNQRDETHDCIALYEWHRMEGRVRRSGEKMWSAEGCGCETGDLDQREFEKYCAHDGREYAREKAADGAHGVCGGSLEWWSFFLTG